MKRDAVALWQKIYQPWAETVISHSIYFSGGNYETIPSVDDALPAADIHGGLWRHTRYGTDS